MNSIKNLLNTLNLLLTLSFFLLLVSCEKDEQTKHAGVFSYNSKNFKLHHGFIKDYGVNWDNTARDYDVFLFSEGITLNESEVGSLFVGTGDGINLEFNSPSIEELSSGSYHWDYFSSEANTLIFGRVFLNFNATSHASGQFIDATDGTARIQINGNSYTINFTLEIDGKTLTGSYSGKLQLLED